MEKQRETAAARDRLDALQRFLERVAPERDGIAARLDEAAAEVLAAFAKVDVDALLLKGRGLARLLYGADGRRAFSDVDLLVAPASFDAAEAALARLGYVDAEAALGIDDIGGVVHGHAWVRSTPRSTDDPPIDLHHRLPGSGAEPAVAWQALAARRAWIELGGRPAPVLDPVGQAMHLATHAAQHGSASEKHLSELELALELWPGDVWESAERLAGEIGATEAFAAGLRLTRRGTARAARLGLPTTQSFDWEIRHRHERPRGTFHLHALAEARSLRDRVDVLRRSLFPRWAWIVREHRWARSGGLRVIAAYGVHLAKAPAWAVHAWMFRRRARRAGTPP